MGIKIKTHDVTAASLKVRRLQHLATLQDDFENVRRLLSPEDALAWLSARYARYKIRASKVMPWTTEVPPGRENWTPWEYEVAVAGKTYCFWTDEHRLIVYRLQPNDPVEKFNTVQSLLTLSHHYQETGVTQIAETWAGP